ncbi:amino acid ABC transporter permease [Hoeflea sp. BAL378]|uniref:amino acid ABC transporter permease n=1 Tax=Hoeflea sp. BAL378 TaxID=1547437 RepID=UPI00068AFE4E|nr:amino acid ABC transporter permease [Hoeflea sp. BAL378]
MSFFDIFRGILEGMDVTLTVTFMGLCFAIPFGLVAGILQHFLKGASRASVTMIIEFWRSTPVLVLMFMFYYSLPTVGIYLSATLVAASTLGLHVGAYGSQSVRAALQALDRGQVEAGFALGLRRPAILWTIELPQMVRAMLPTFVNQLIQLVKGTSLVALITMSDMTHRAKEISQLTFDPPAIYSALLLAYFILLYPITIFGRWLERKVGQGSGKLMEDHGRGV